MLVAFLALPVTAAQPDASSGDELARVLELRPDARLGAALYAPCVSCHGRDGQGTPAGTVPAIGGQHPRVVARQLVAYRHAERWDPNMEEIAEKHGLSDPQAVADLSAHVALLSPRAAPGHGDGGQIDLGRQLYVRDCASCHGTGGAGDDLRMIPRVAAQNYAYLLRQFHDTLDQRRPSMPEPHRSLLDDLDVSGLTGLADYISRLPSTRTR
jgi:cytochrome c553